MSGIMRTVKDGRYFVASNEPFNDARLSWEARGLLGYLLSKPDGWVTRNKNLINMGPAGQKKIERILEELKDLGYMRRYRLRKKDGTFRWVTDIFESPNLNPDHTPQKGVRSIPPKTSNGYGGYIKSTDLLNTDRDIVKENNDLADDLDDQANIQEIAQIIKIDLGGNGDDARVGRNLYFEYRGQKTLEEIAKMAASRGDQ